MEADLLIRNGYVYTDGTFKKRDVGIRGEKIAFFIESGRDVQAACSIDADGKYVIPGMIDFHTHIREPGVGKKKTITPVQGLRLTAGSRLSVPCPII